MTRLTQSDSAILDGRKGQAAALAMRVILTAARTERAPRLISIRSAHVDSCLYHGPSSLDFVRALLDGGASVSVPTTLNVGAIDREQPELFRGQREEAAAASELMDCYVRLGCQPTFTCAPYQLFTRPAFGTHVAWAESNAIAFGNSVIGLRTNRYGDFIDICAAITGRVPYSGFHVTRNRAARAVFTIGKDALSSADPDLLPALLGHHIGRASGGMVPAVVGLKDAGIGENWCKSFGSAAASSGSTGMFHIVGVTPEAPDLDSALQRRLPLMHKLVSAEDLSRAHNQLTTAQASAVLGGVSIGTPHLSRQELVTIAEQLSGKRVKVPTYATTSRDVLSAEPLAVAKLHASGVTIIRDTCTYMTPIMRPQGAVMTNSAKWAYYAPSLLGFKVLLASLNDCLLSALEGEIVLRDKR